MFPCYHIGNIDYVYVSVYLNPSDDPHNTMSPMLSPVFLVTSSLVFPLVLSSPVLVEQRSLMGCQCSAEATAKVGLAGGGQLVILVDITG